MNRRTFFGWLTKGVAVAALAGHMKLGELIPVPTAARISSTTDAFVPCDFIVQWHVPGLGTYLREAGMGGTFGGPETILLEDVDEILEPGDLVHGERPLRPDFDPSLPIIYLETEEDCRSYIARQNAAHRELRQKATVLRMKS